VGYTKFDDDTPDEDIPDPVRLAKGLTGTEEAAIRQGYEPNISSWPIWNASGQEALNAMITSSTDVLLKRKNKNRLSCPVLACSCRIGFSATPPLPIGVWSWLTGGN
jgi:hypothetical protein